MKEGEDTASYFSYIYFYLSESNRTDIIFLLNKSKTTGVVLGGNQFQFTWAYTLNYFYFKFMKGSEI